MEYTLPNQIMDTASDNSPSSSFSSSTSGTSDKSREAKMVAMRKRNITDILGDAENHRPYGRSSLPLLAQVEAVPTKKLGIASSVKGEETNRPRRRRSTHFSPDSRLVSTERGGGSSKNILREAQWRSSPLLLASETEVVPLKKSSRTSALEELDSQTQRLDSTRLAPDAETIPPQRSSTSIQEELDDPAHGPSPLGLISEAEVLPMRNSLTNIQDYLVESPPQTLESPTLSSDAEIAPQRRSSHSTTHGDSPPERLGSPKHSSEGRMVSWDAGSSSTNMLGEVAFQLERRILDYVFANSLPDTAQDSRVAAHSRIRQGYTVSNIGEMINKEALAGEKYSRGTERMRRERLRTLLDILTPMGYDLLDHGAFSRDIINKYGLLARPLSATKQSGAYSGTEVGIPGTHVADVQNYIFSAAETDDERDNLLLLFDCLRMLAIEDGLPLFIW